VNSLKLALVQLHIAPGERDRNLQHALDLTRDAAANGANLILLPEALPFGWMDLSAKLHADEIPNGATCQRLCDAAREHRVFLCAGLIERDGQHLYNAAILIDPNGSVLLHHRKINELDIAQTLYSHGDRLAVTETPFGRIGLMICADGFAPGQVISRTLGMMGAQLIISPCAWAVPPGHDNSITPYGQLWIDNYTPVARELNLWIAGCSNVGPIRSGPWSGHKCIGCSMVITPSGTKELSATYGETAEEICYLSLDLKNARNTARAGA
jgi:predicted amidohydrolase